jgi:uncharacterized protein YjiS (DUF1127 family)
MPSFAQTFAPVAARPAPRRRGLFGILALDSLRRQRNDLRNLTDEQLRDVGLTREQAQAEARRPVWDVPAHWIA